MSAPSPPIILPVAGSAAQYEVTIELSQADLLAIAATSDWRKEIGSATPAGFTNPVVFTLSRLAQVPPP